MLDRREERGRDWLKGKGPHDCGPSLCDIASLVGVRSGVVARRIRSRIIGAAAERLRSSAGGTCALGEAVHLCLGDGGDCRRLREVEGEQTFGGNEDLTVVGCCGCAEAGCSADACADGSALSSAYRGTDERAEDAADDGAVDGLDCFVGAVVLPDVGGDGVAGSAEIDGGELQRELAAALDCAGLFGVDHGAVDGCATRDGDGAASGDIVDDDAVEMVAGLGALSVEGLVDADADERASGDGDLLTRLLAGVGRC